jgi:hypothetical protein
VSRHIPAPGSPPWPSLPAPFACVSTPVVLRRAAHCLDQCMRCAMSYWTVNERAKLSLRHRGAVVHAARSPPHTRGVQTAPLAARSLCDGARGGQRAGGYPRHAARADVAGGRVARSHAGAAAAAAAAVQRRADGHCGGATSRGLRCCAGCSATAEGKLTPQRTAGNPNSLRSGLRGRLGGSSQAETHRASARLDLEVSAG